LHSDQPARWRAALVLGAALSLSSGCGEENHQRVIAPPFPDGSVLIADSGFPDPVVVPPPSVQPAMDAGIVMPRLPTTGVDAGLRPDGGRSDAGSVVISADGSVPPSTDPNAGNPCGMDPEPLAANIRISEVAMYQTVKVSLFKNDAWVTPRNAALVQGKKSLVRAFVTPQTGFAPRALRGILTLNTDGRTNVIISDRMVSTASTDEGTTSTFDFPIDGALIAGSTQLSVSVIETACMAPAATPGARVPATGTQMLGADAIAKFRVVVVPITLSGRTPDTSAAQLEKFRGELLAYYPVAEVEVTARAPVAYTGTVQSSGSGWSEVLSLVGRTRQQDAPAASVYYFGLMMPGATFRDYCRSGCVAGLAPQTTVISRSNQIGLGVGYVDPTTASTMAHELGHAHGLPHAPCTRGGTIEGADAHFPYAGAKIGVWGWDSRVAKLMSPTMYVDLMSYCDPVWISDYNYAKIATRAKAVNTAAFIYEGEALAQTWHGIILRADGSAAWSGMTASEAPGETSSARALDAQGHALSTIDVVRVALSQTGDSFLYVPEPAAGWAAIDLGDRVLQLEQVAPAPQ
jgi:hypothetical protein